MCFSVTVAQQRFAKTPIPDSNDVPRLSGAAFLNLCALILSALLSACSATVPPAPTDVLALPWDQIEQQARGETAHLRMWTGDPLINAYMNDFVARRLLERNGV